MVVFEDSVGVMQMFLCAENESIVLLVLPSSTNHGQPAKPEKYKLIIVVQLREITFTHVTHTAKVVYSASIGMYYTYVLICMC